MKTYKHNILLDRFDLFSLLDYINEHVEFDENDNAIQLDPIEIKLSIQPKKENILVQSDDDKLLEYIACAEIDLIDDDMDLQYQYQLAEEGKREQLKHRMQSSCNPDVSFTYSRERSLIDDEYN